MNESIQAFFVAQERQIPFEFTQKIRSRLDTRQIYQVEGSSENGTPLFYSHEVCLTFKNRWMIFDIELMHSFERIWVRLMPTAFTLMPNRSETSLLVSP